MKVVNVNIPQSADTQVLHNPMAGDIIALNFPTTDVALSRVGDNLVFEFSSGRSAVLNGFYNVYNSQNMPTFLVDDQEIPGEVFFAAMESSDLMPAAGPTASTQNADGSFFNAGSGQELMTGTGEGMEGESFTSGLTRNISFTGAPETNSVLLASAPIDTNVPPVSTIPPTGNGTGSDGNGGSSGNDGSDDNNELPSLGGGGTNPPAPTTTATYDVNETTMSAFGMRSLDDQQTTLDTHDNYVFNVSSTNGNAFGMRAGGGSDTKASNTITGGDGENSVIMNISNVATSQNFIANSQTMTAMHANTDDKKANVQNNIELGKGNDVVDINVEGGRGLVANTTGIKADSSNTIAMGKGSDKVTIDAVDGMSAVVSAKKATSVNSIELGKGNDSLDITAEKYGMRAINQDASNQDALYQNAEAINSIEAGNGKDSVTIQAETAMRAVGGTNSIDLGNGNDSLLIDGKISATVTGQNIIDGGAGNDSLRLENINTENSYVFSGNTADFTVETADATFKNFETFEFGDSKDNVDFSNFTSATTIYTHKGNDTIISDNTVNDSVFAGKGDDLIRFNAGDTLDGGNGFDIGVVSDATQLDFTKYNNVELFVAGNVAGDNVTQVLESLGLSIKNGKIEALDVSIWKENATQDPNNPYTSYTNEDNGATIWVQDSVNPNIPPATTFASFMHDIRPMSLYYGNENITTDDNLIKSDDNSGMEQSLADTLESYMDIVNEANENIDLTSKSFMTEHGMSYEEGTLVLDANWDYDGIWRNTATGLELDNDIQKEVEITAIAG